MRSGIAFPASSHSSSPLRSADAFFPTRLTLLEAAGLREQRGRKAMRYLTLLSGEAVIEPVRAKSVTDAANGGVRVSGVD